MDAVVGGNERIAEVVNGVLHEFVKFLVVVHEIVGITEVDGRFTFKKFIIRSEDVTFIREVGR